MIARRTAGSVLALTVLAATAACGSGGSDDASGGASGAAGRPHASSTPLGPDSPGCRPVTGPIKETDQPRDTSPKPPPLPLHLVHSPPLAGDPKMLGTLHSLGTATSQSGGLTAYGTGKESTASQEAFVDDGGILLFTESSDDESLDDVASTFDKGTYVRLPVGAQDAILLWDPPSNDFHGRPHRVLFDRGRDQLTLVGEYDAQIMVTLGRRLACSR